MTSLSAELVQVPYPKMRNINFTVSRIIQEQVHVHSSVEVGLVLDGSMRIKTENLDYQASRGDIFLFNAYEIHRFVPDTQTTVLFLHLAPSFGKAHFVRFVSLEFNFKPNKLPDSVRAELGDKMIEGATVFLQEPDAYGMECAGLVCGVATMLLRNIPYTMNSDVEHMAKKKKIGRKQRIASYVEQHYREKLTLTQLAQAEGITTAYMSRIFGELFDKPFQEYLSRLRLQKALPLLKKSSVYLVDICMECGFSDTRYLNAVCQKEYGHSAIELREKMQKTDWQDPNDQPNENKEILDTQDALAALQSYING